MVFSCLVNLILDVFPNSVEDKCNKDYVCVMNSWTKDIGFQEGIAIFGRYPVIEIELVTLVGSLVSR